MAGVGSIFYIPTTTGNVTQAELAADLALKVNSANAIITGNASIAGNTKTSSLTATSFVQPYAPITLSSTIEFYGDSITIGSAGLPSPSTQRWSALLCASRSATEHNWGIGGTGFPTLPAQAFNNHVSGNSSFIAYGTNDIKFYSPIYFKELMDICYDQALFLCLPSSSIFNARSVTQTGTWTNNSNFSTYGVGTSTTSSTLSCTTTGRYVSISFMVPTGSTAASYAGYTVTIDSAVIPCTQANYCNINTGYITFNWIYDTQSSSSTTHTVLITFTGEVGGYTGQLYVNWIGGFSNSQSSCAPVVIVNVNQYLFSGWGSDMNMWTSFNLGLQTVARKLRTEFRLPVYFAQNGYSYNEYSQSNDNLHPNIGGSIQVFKDISNIITNGEINYLNS